MFRIVFLLLIVFGFSQKQKNIDFITCNASVTPNFIEKSISGNVLYTFKTNNYSDSIKIDAINMEVDEVLLNGKKINFKNNFKTISFKEKYKSKNKVVVKYKAFPKQTLYFVGTKEEQQIWTQGQGKYTSYWLPSFDDVNEKVIFNLSVSFDKNYEIISNGKLVKTRVDDLIKYNTFQMKKPMSSYLVMLAIGKYVKKDFKTQSNTPLQLYIDEHDIEKHEPTYRNSIKIFDYLEQEIQFKYPWKIYKQIPVRDFLYAGMENTTSTIFSQDFVVDTIGFNDRNYCNVNAHELAHQWFGNVVTAKTSKHHWLQEGFATYYALLAEKEVFGEDYFYNELLEYALQIKNASKTDTIPVLNEKASSLSFYKKGAWILHTIREDIGEDNFRKVVKNYLTKYQFKNVETEDFLNEITKVIPQFDKEKLYTIWLDNSKFDFKLAENYLIKNKFCEIYLDLLKKKINLSEYESLMKSDVYFPVKQYMLQKTENLPFDQKKNLIDLAFKSDIYTRQTLSETFSQISVEYIEKCETLLDDLSYTTRENTLINLVTNFPEKANYFLKKMANQLGNNDLSLRFTWLKLSIQQNTNDITLREKYFDELLTYSKPPFESSIRINALDILLQIDKMDHRVIESLFLATNHHKWQFTKFSRERVRKYLKYPEYRAHVVQLKENVSEELKTIMERFLNE